jgi:hypothetical protein
MATINLLAATGDARMIAAGGIRERDGSRVISGECASVCSSRPARSSASSLR